MEKLGRLLTAMVTPFNVGKPRLPLTKPDEKQPPSSRTH